MSTLSVQTGKVRDATQGRLGRNGSAGITSTECCQAETSRQVPGSHDEPHSADVVHVSRAMGPPDPPPYPCTGLPIRPVFSKPLPSKPALKARLKLDKHLPAVLLIGGGEGMGKLEETVDRIADNLGGQCQVGRKSVGMYGLVTGGVDAGDWSQREGLTWSKRRTQWAME